jgi:hypothetical protein
VPRGRKASVDRDDLVAEHLPRLFKHLLRPMGLAEAPGDIDAAITVSRAPEESAASVLPAIGADESGVRAAVSARPLTSASGSRMNRAYGSVRETERRRGVITAATRAW